MNPSLVRELIDDLEAEINNGGFDQFFFNSVGDRTADIIQALKLIGANHTASIVEAAAAKFPGGMPPVDRFERQRLLQSISPDNDLFDSFDQAFYEYQDDLLSLVDQYGR